MCACVYVSSCVYVCVRVSTCVSVCICACARISVCDACMCARECACVCVRACMCVPECVCVRVCAWLCTHACSEKGLARGTGRRPRPDVWLEGGSEGASSARCGRQSLHEGPVSCVFSARGPWGAGPGHSPEGPRDSAATDAPACRGGAVPRSARGCGARGFCVATRVIFSGTPTPGSGKWGFLSVVTAP